MKKFVIFLIIIIQFIFFSVYCYAQTPEWLWAKSAGGDSSDVGQSVAVDSTGNVFVAGEFQSHKIIFGKDTLYNADTNIISQNIFLVKYDTDGNVKWARSAANCTGVGVWAVATDKSGNAYIGGNFRDYSIKFGEITLQDSLWGGAFIVKYNTNGKVIWAKKAGGDSSYDVISSITTDAAGNVIITGYFQSSKIQFDSIILYKGFARREIFIAKFNKDGKAIWAERPIAHGSGAQSNSVSVDASGNIYVAGGFGGSYINFGNITSGIITLYTDNWSMFLVKYNKDGKAIWGKTAKGECSATNVISDIYNNIYIAGYLGTDSVWFDSYILTQKSFCNSTLFIAKYDSTGKLEWAKGAQDCNWVSSITSDIKGNIYMTGIFSGYYFIFDTDTLRSSILGKMFNVCINPSGNVLWTNMVESNYPESISADKLGNIFITGEFTSPSGAFGSIILTGQGEGDIFLAKLSSIVSVKENNIEKSSNLMIYPNPAGEIANIKYQIPDKSEIQIKIYDVIGNEIGMLVSEEKQKGEYAIKYNVERFKSGLYFIKLTSKEGISVKKFIKN